LKIIISHEIGSLHDGPNAEFCIAVDERKEFPRHWIKWWISFTVFRGTTGKSTTFKGKPIGNINLDDYNFLKEAIHLRYIRIMPKDWPELEVSFPFYYYLFYFIIFFTI